MKSKQTFLSHTNYHKLYVSNILIHYIYVEYIFGTFKFSNKQHKHPVY